MATSLALGVALLVLVAGCQGAVKRPVADGPATAPTSATTPKEAAPPAAEGTCVLTGKAPVKPDGVLPRCVAEQELSCCTVCQDATAGLTILSKNGSSLVNFVSLVQDPTVAAFASVFTAALANQQLCNMFTRNPDCLNQIESLYCAINCSPNAGKFLQVKGTNATMSVCNAFAASLYAQCSTIIIPQVNAPLKNYIKTPEGFLQSVVGPVALSVTGLKFLTTNVVPDAQGVASCFNGPAVYPKTNLCCDELSNVPSSCVSTGVSTKASTAGANLASYVNRTIPSSQNCPAEGATGNNTSGGSTAKSAPHTISAISGLITLALGAASWALFA